MGFPRDLREVLLSLPCDKLGYQLSSKSMPRQNIEPGSFRSAARYIASQPLHFKIFSSKQIRDNLMQRFQCWSRYIWAYVKKNVRKFLPYKSCARWRYISDIYVSGFMIRQLKTRWLIPFISPLEKMAPRIYIIATKSDSQTINNYTWLSFIWQSKWRWLLIACVCAFADIFQSLTKFVLRITQQLRTVKEFWRLGMHQRGLKNFQFWSFFSTHALFCFADQPQFVGQNCINWVKRWRFEVPVSAKQTLII